MGRRIAIKKSTVKVNNGTEGEAIEKAIKRAIENGESLGDQVGLIYTARRDGVLAGYDIRTDRFDVALEGINVAQKSALAKREALAKKESPDSKAGEPTQATDGNPQ